MSEARRDQAIPDAISPSLRVTFHDDGSYTVHDTRPGPRKFVRMVMDAEWPPPAPGHGVSLSAEQSGYVHLLERLVARVRVGEVRMLRYSAVAGTREMETGHGTYDVEPTGEMTLTLWCQQLVAPGATATAAPPPAPPTPEDPRANVRIDTYVQSVPNGMWTITATNLLTGASVTRQGRGSRTAAEREAVDAVAGAPSFTKNRRDP